MLENNTATRRWRIYLIDVMVVVGIAGLITYKSITREPDRRVATSDFARAVDLGPLNGIAVQADGRLRSFESHSKTYMGYISGPRQIHGQANAFSYLDLMFRSDLYEDIDMIYVKNKQVRDQLLTALAGNPTLDGERTEAIRKSGLFSRQLLNQPASRTLLEKLGLDLIKTEKVVRAIESALTVSDPRFLSNSLKMIAPPSGLADQPWYALEELKRPGGMPQDGAHAGMMGVKIEGLAIETQQQLADSWSKLRLAWKSQNAEESSAAILALSSVLPTIAPSLYPSGDRLGWESWYFRNKSMSGVWLVYLLCVIPLLMAIIYKWQAARTIGMFLFVVAFGLQTASIALRWYISGRWPNANMYEAVTTSAWSGGLAAIILERIARKTNFRNIFALGSAVMSMIALMAAYFLPTQLDSGISNKMAALNDVWLYIHTNVIIWSYAVIGVACVPALLFLRNRWCLLWDQLTIPKLRLLILPIAMLAANITGGMLLMHLIAYSKHGLTREILLASSATFWMSSTIIALELLSARARRLAGVKGVDRAASGGASAIMAATPSSDPFVQAERPTSSQVYDGATMVLVELSFVMLWTGVVMGAIWADHSWGRPWGWDPKEVFALNTFIIFLILIHVRMKVKDKGFWTAIIALIGFEVMMFNWIVVNFIIVGLHSYA